MTTTPEHPPNRGPRDGGEEFGIVVGVDGSADSHHALQTAAKEALRRDLPLTMICNYSLHPSSDSARQAGQGLAPESTLRQHCEETLEEARTTFLAEHTGPVRSLVRFGDPARLLVDCSPRATRLVVGTRGLGGFVGRVVGSVSSALPEYSACPTLIVPSLEESPEAATDEAPTHERTVTVGLDGSEHSLSAALEAAREAEERHLPLHLLRAIPPVRSIFSWHPQDAELESMEASLTTELQGDREWLQSHFPRLDVQTSSAQGGAVDALAEDNHRARLTVLGAAGRGGYLGRRLGSTTRGLINRARNPVLVVPYRHDRRIQDRQQFPGGAELIPADE